VGAGEGGERGDGVMTMEGLLDKTDDDGRHAGSERWRREAGRIRAAVMRGGSDRSSGNERRARSEQR
jgi:hypothetical protein